MKYKEAKFKCHLRSAIFRKAKPKIKYWKNNPISLDKRVSFIDKFFTDWEEYDPRTEPYENLA